MTSFSHCVTCHVLAPAATAFAYLADPIKLGRWSLGCFDTGPADAAGLYTGLSLFDGGRGWYSIRTEPALRSIDYLVGTPGRLTHRISARILDASTLNYPSDTCLASLTAWRPADMPDDRWRRLCASHEAEIWLIKAQIEMEFASAASRG